MVNKLRLLYYKGIIPGNAVSSLSDAKSNLLNNMRWVCALLVVLGHTELYSRMLHAHPTEQVFPIYHYFTAHAHAAVIVFFVISGYLVGYTTYRKLLKEKVGLSDKACVSKVTTYDFREFFLDRWSRIYSVLILAVLFTIVLDYFGNQFSANYSNPHFIPQNYKTVRFLINIASLQGIHGMRVQLGTNPALWSIGYGFCYYMIFGLFVFREDIFKGNKIVFLAIILAISLTHGIKVMLYFTIWFTGFLSFLLFHQLKLRIPSIFTIPLLIILVVANHFVVFKDILGVSEYIQDLIIAAIVSLLLICDSGDRAPNTYIRAIGQYLADFSYSLYAFHMPLLFLFFSIMPVNQSADRLGIYHLVSVLICFLIARFFYYITEYRRNKYRAAMSDFIDYILRHRRYFLKAKTL